MSDQLTEPRDKVERSPTGHAQCRLCANCIRKGDWRIGIHKLERGRHNLHYYHKSCLMETSVKVRGILANFNPTGKRRDQSTRVSPRMLVEREVAKVTELSLCREILISSRNTLKNMLKVSRTEFAKREGKKTFMIFSDSILDSLVETMPSNEKELMKIKGIGVQKVSKYGSMILSTISSYKSAQPVATSMQRQNNNGRRREASPEVIVLLSSDDEDEEPFQRSKPENICTESDDDDDPDEVIIEKELSVDEIVRKRIRDAEEKGDVIVL